MAIEFLCPACRETLRVADDAAGRMVRCGGCMTVIRAPEPPADTPAPRRRPAAEPVEPGEPTPPPRPRRDPDRVRRPRRMPPPRHTVLFWLVIAFGVVGLGVVTCCGGLFLVLQPKWRTHTSDRGGFAVELPADPRDDMAKLAGLKNQPGAAVEGTILFIKLEEYGVIYSDIDPPVRRTMTDDQIIDETVKGLLTDEPGSKLRRSTPVVVSGFPAREVVFDGPDGSAMARVVVADTRLYVVIAGGPGGSAENERVRRFLDSFRVTDKKLLDAAGRKKRDDPGK